jgi:hypothetical protein
LRVPLPGPTPSREDLQARFEAAYHARFRVDLPNIRANLVNLNVSVIGQRPDIDLSRLIDPAGRLPRATPHATRQVWFGGPVEADDDGFAPVRAIGSAALLISREALVRIAESGLVAHAHSGMYAADQHEDGWTFFDPFVDEDGHYLSEDYALCHRWRTLGGQVWADLETTTRHIGPVTITGDIHGSLAAASDLARRDAAPDS